MQDESGRTLARRAADPNNEPVKFINGLDTHGFLNGVVNLTLTTARFSAGLTVEDLLSDVSPEVKVSEDAVVAARLRMDLYTAQELHAALGAIISKNTTKPDGEKVN